MGASKIAYLAAPTFQTATRLDEPSRLTLNLARGAVAASGGRIEIEWIAFGASPSVTPIAPGIVLRTLSASRNAGNPLDAVSWEMIDVIAGADLVHTHRAYTRCAEVALLVAKQQRKPVCVSDHGLASSPLMIQLGALDLADRVIAYSDFGASLYRTSAPLTVIKGVADASTYTPATCHAGRDRFVYVGELSPRHGVDRLIRALPADLALSVCGRASSPSYWEHLHGLAADKNVKFVTDFDDEHVIDLYRRSWAAIVPAAGGAGLSGLAILEANACGTPSLCARVGAFPEFVEDGVTGFVFDDEGGLTDRLSRLANEAELSDRLGAEGRRRVEREGNAGAKLAAIYEAMIGGGSASGAGGIAA